MRWLHLALACAGGLVAGCAPTISKVHAEAVSTQLGGLAAAARSMAQDAPRHVRCQAGDDPVTVRVDALSAKIQDLAGRAADYSDGRWPSQDAFREALAEGSELQMQLALLRAEYDACRALSARPVDDDGIPIAPGTPRMAVLDLDDPGRLLTEAERAGLAAHLRARLRPVFGLVPAEAVDEAQLDHSTGARCPAACVLSVAREVGAHKAVRVALERRDARCAVILEMYDVATGIAERARTVRQDCGSQSLLSGLEDAIAPLVQ